MDNRRGGSKRDRRRTQCKCFCPDPYICSRLSVFLHYLCGTDCDLLLAYPQKKIQSGCMDENYCLRFCIGGLSQTRFVLDFRSAYTAGCTFSNCGFWRKIVFGSCCLFENKSPAIYPDFEIYWPVFDSQFNLRPQRDSCVIPFLMTVYAQMENLPGKRRYAFL